MLSHISGASHLLSTVESIHLCEKPVCAVGVCNWWLARVSIGKLHATHTQFMHSYIGVGFMLFVLVFISGWSDSNVRTTQTVNGAICTSGKPGMYGLLQGD